MTTAAKPADKYTKVKRQPNEREQRRVAEKLRRNKRNKRNARHG